MEPEKKEVMRATEDLAATLTEKYMIKPETLWQPADLLPDPGDDDFESTLRDIQGLAKELDDDLFAVLIGDTVTEEALPTYESWLMETEGISQKDKNAWSSWLRKWTAEENRHGDVLHTYLYLSGRVDMRQFQLTTQYLLQDGFYTGMEHCPYRSFVYTSFQELATNVSHRRVASLAKKGDNKLLAKICAVVAGDEMRHANAYIDFVSAFLERDPSGVVIAFSRMMKLGIMMPGHYMRESGQPQGELFEHFKSAAIRTGVYTGFDYVNILQTLIDKWNLAQLRDLSDRAERERDFLMKLPDRLTKMVERTPIPQDRHEFQWLLKR